MQTIKNLFVVISFVLFLITFITHALETSYPAKFKQLSVAGYNTRLESVDSPLLTDLSGVTDIFISSNDVYIVDSFSSVVKKVSISDGKTKIVAGNGNLGLSADGQLAIKSSLASPESVFVNAQNEMFIADFSNHRIAKVDSNGQMSTMIMNKTEIVTPRSISYSSKFGFVFTERNMLRSFKDGLLINLAGIKTQFVFRGDGFGLNCTLNDPRALFVEENGEVLIVDTGNNRIRRFTSDRNIITIAGGGLESVSKENVLALNATLSNLGKIVSVPNLGMILFTQGHAVRKLQNGLISTLVGNITQSGFGPNLLNNPRGISVSNTNILYIADRGNKRVRSFDLVRGGALQTFAGYLLNEVDTEDKVATSVPLGKVWGLHVTPEKEVYFTETSRNRIRKVDNKGKISTIAGFSSKRGYNGENVHSTSSLLNQPTGIFVNSQKEVFFAEPFNYKIRKIQTNGNITTVAGGDESTPLKDFVPPTQSKLFQSSGFTFNNDQMLIADLNNNLIRQVSFTSNLITTLAGNVNNRLDIRHNVNITVSNTTALALPSSIAVSKLTGDIYYTDQSSVKKISNSRVLSLVAGLTTPSFNGDSIRNSSAAFNYPRGIFIHFDTHLNQEVLYIADTVNRRIRKITNLSTNPQVETVLEESDYITSVFVHEFEIYYATGNQIKKYEPTCSDNSQLSTNGKTCTCTEGYSVMDGECSYFECFGEKFDSASVCSGNGICEKPNVCVCSGSWNGTNCDRMALSGAHTVSHITIGNFGLILIGICLFLLSIF